MSLVTFDYQGKTKAFPNTKTFTNALSFFSLSGQASDYDFVCNGQPLDIQDLNKAINSQVQGAATIQIYKKGGSLQGAQPKQPQFSQQQSAPQPQFQSTFQQAQPQQPQFQSGYQQGQQFQQNPQQQQVPFNNPFASKYGQSVNNTTDLLPPQMENLNINNKPQGFGQVPPQQPQQAYQAQQGFSQQQKFQPAPQPSQSSQQQSGSVPNFSAAPKPVIIKKALVTEQERQVKRVGDQSLTKEINGWTITIDDWGAKVILEAENGDFKAVFLEAEASNEGTAKLQLNPGMFINDPSQMNKLNNTKVLLQSSRKGIAIYWFSKLVTLFEFYLDD